MTQGITRCNSQTHVNLSCNLDFCGNSVSSDQNLLISKTQSFGPLLKVYDYALTFSEEVCLVYVFIMKNEWLTTVTGGSRVGIPRYVGKYPVPFESIAVRCQPHILFTT